MVDIGMTMDWRSASHRENVRKKLADAMQGIPPQTHSPNSIEAQLFQRSKSGEEYMNSLSNILKKLHERSTNRQAVANQEPQSNQQRPDSNPIGALQMMTRQPGSGPNAPNAMMNNSSQQSMGGPQFQGGMNPNGGGMMMVNQGQMMQGGQPQGGPGPPMMPGGMAVGPPRGPVGNAPHNVMTPQQQQMFQQRMNQRLAMQQRAMAAQQQQQQQQQNQSASISQSGMIPNQPVMMSSQPTTSQAIQARPPFQAGMPMGGAGGPPTVAISTGMPMPTMAHSPSGHAMANNQIRSPANYNHFLPSPTGSVQGPQGNIPKIHSPASTFQGPPSVGPPSVEKIPNAPSPGNPMSTPRQHTAASPAPATEMDSQCQQKLQELAGAYIEPLKKWIAIKENSDNKELDPKKVVELKKMRALLDMLENKNQQNLKVNIELLQKCELALHNMLNSPANKLKPMKDQSLGQSLLDALLEQFKKAPTAKSFSVNHQLARSFGPAVSNLLGPLPQPPSPPPAKKRKMEAEVARLNRCRVPRVLQGEIARLAPRFRVRRDPSSHEAASVLHLRCVLDDPRLPAVPSINVRVPEDYPASSPSWDPERSTLLTTTSFLREAKKLFGERLAKMPELHSLSSLLDMWEMTVRQCCVSKE